MRIRGNHHGLADGIQVSPDLLAADKDNARDTEIVTVIYDWEGDLADVFFISKAFADSHQLQGGRSTLPDSWPEWVRLTKPACRPCFEEKFHGTISHPGCVWRMH